MPLAALVLSVGGAWFYISRITPDTSLSPMEVVPLTTFPGQEITPSLSPDGKQIAFAWNGEKQDNFDIYVQLIGAGTVTVRRWERQLAIYFPSGSAPDLCELVWKHKYLAN